jgi:hypothetical protein
MNSSDLSTELGFSALTPASSVPSVGRHAPNRESRDQPRGRPRPPETDENDFGAEAEAQIMEEKIRHQLDDLA